MKTIGIIGAMEEEVSELLKKYKAKDKKKILNYEYHISVLENKKIIVVQSGIGKVNSAICAQILIDRFNVDYVINTGVAGAISNELEIGDVVFSDETMQYDVDVTAFGYKLGQIPRMGENYRFKSSELLISKSENIVKEKGYKYYIGQIVSGDCFVGTDEKKKWISGNFDAMCVDMESGSIGHVCDMNGIPYIAVRCISDTSDDSAKMKYEDFIPIALEKCFIITSYLIEEL